MKISIYNTPLISQVNKNTLQNLLQYLIHNRFTIVLNKDKMTMLINDIPTMSRNTISEFFDKLHETNYEYFSFISTLFKSDIPECLLYNHFNVDIYELKSFKDSSLNILDTVPEYKDKIIFNLNAVLNKEQTKILDVITFQKVMVRSLCSRSYYNFKNAWINGSFINMLCKFYSIPIASNLSRLYNLSMSEMYNLAIIYAYFFVNKCTEIPSEDQRKLLSNYHYLGSSSNINNVTNLIDESLQKKYSSPYFDSLNKLVYIINEIAPKRLSNLDLKHFYTISRSFNYNSLVSLISIEYPGYWLYNLYTVTSGERNNLYFLMTNTNLLKETIQFISDLNYNPVFFSSFDPI